MNLDERDQVAEQFGVAPEQVERDHLISHLLAFLSARYADKIHFIGGTALARTRLQSGRLSEDIDLVALDSRSRLAADLDKTLPQAAMRAHGRLSWESTLSSVPDTAGAVLNTSAGWSLKIQLLSSADRTLWPVEHRALVQRYDDAPRAELQVPTLSAFAASRTATWHDRRAPRDLWDLWALNDIGAINSDAAELFRRLGPTNRVPGTYLFDVPPPEDVWRAQLAGQTRLTVTAAYALEQVREAWQAMSGRAH